MDKALLSASPSTGITGQVDLCDHANPRSTFFHRANNVERSKHPVRHEAEARRAIFFTERITWSE